MSIYFNNIFSFFDKNENNFDLILDQNGVEFINHINSFLYSKKMFYLIYGSMGIGKTITLMYYPSLLIKEYGNLY